MGNCCSSSSSSSEPDIQLGTSHENQKQQQVMSNAPQDTSQLFVESRNGNLHFKGWPESPVLRFASFNAPELTDGSCADRFEIEDTMRTIAGLGQGLPLRVTRTYTLRIKSKNWGHGHIMGWDHDKAEWLLHEGCWEELDYILAKAAEYDVRLIIPIINQENGNNCNWVGDFCDLACMRHDLPDYETGRQLPFFKDRTMIDAYKTLISQLLNRVNTINGRRYGSDPTVLAWQTGNEMRLGHDKPPPGAWTEEICAHIKSLAPDTLTADGSHAKCESASGSFDKQALKSPHIDIFSNHYYGGELGDDRVTKEANIVHQKGKVFIATEYGFFRQFDAYPTFLHQVTMNGSAGSLIWSLRPHGVRGGFKTHAEDSHNHSYHLPGLPAPLPDSFDQREQPIAEAVRNANYWINGQSPQAHPIPIGAPKLWAEKRNNYNGLVFQGSAWAKCYELWNGDQCLSNAISDSVPDGQLHVPLYGPGTYKIRGLSVEGQPGPWSNEIAA